MKRKLSTEQTLYFIGLAAIVIGAAGFFFISLLPESLRRFLVGPCPLLTLTGFYCPGCGGSRAVYYLLHGKLLKSLICHPIVLYGLAVGLPFMVTQTLALITKGRIRGMRFRPGYLYAAAVIIIANFVLKNVLKLIFHIDLLAI